MSRVSEFDGTPDGTDQTNGGWEGFDLSGVDEEYKEADVVVPADTYQCRVTEITPKKSANGNPMIVWVLIIISGKHKGRKIWKNWVFTEAALGMIKQDARAIGFTLPISQFPANAGKYVSQAIEVERKLGKGTDQSGNPNFNHNFKRLLNIPVDMDVEIVPPPEDVAPF